MKNPKLTKQEKAEIRRENSQWKDFIRRMRDKTALIEDKQDPATQKTVQHES